MKDVNFLRIGKTYYCEYKGERHEVNERMINKLSENLKLPCTITFEFMSLSQSQKILGKLIDKNISYNFLLKEKNGKTFFEATLYQKKNIVGAYCITSKVCLYGRNPNCKPYVLHTLGEQKILMEVTKEYIKENNEVFYFLYSELTDEEKEFFSPVYREIECDHIYKIAEEKQCILGRRKK